MKRGEVWWASLPDPVGSGPGLRRPAIVIQSNPFNESKISNVVVATVTSNLALAAAPGNVRVAKADTGLPQPSVINVSQLSTIDRSRLTERIKSLPANVIQTVDAGLRKVLAL